MAKSYSNGPIDNQQRKCTDVCCLVFYIFISICIFTMAIYAGFTKGLSHITTFADSDGQHCGIEKRQGFPFVYFVSPHRDSITNRVCVKSCPQGDETRLNCAINSKINTCVELDTGKTQTSVQIYPTHQFLGRICLPQSKYLTYRIVEFLGIEIPEDQLNVLYKNWLLIVLTIPAAIIVTLIVMLLIRFTACCMVYFLILASILAFLALGYYFFVESLKSGDIKHFGISVAILYKIATGICALLAVIILIAFCCFKKRINIAIKMIKASARFVNNNCYLFFIQIFKFLWIVAFLIVWFALFGGILVFKDIILKNQQLSLNDTQQQILSIVIIAFHVFYLFWTVVFIIETGTFLTVGTAVNWYFQQEDQCSESFTRYKSYHLGSVLAGSLLIALFGFFKMVYQLLKPKSQEEDSVFAKIEKFCDCCCFLCVMFVFKLLNRGAYAFIHLAGRSYCQSSIKVFSFRTSEPVLSGVMTFLHTIFSLIIRISIIAILCGIGYCILTFLQPFKTQTSDPTTTLIVIGLLTLLVTELFVPIYVDAADTIVVCFLIDKEHGEGEDNCPKELRSYLEETRKNDGFLD